MKITFQHLRTALFYGLALGTLLALLAWAEYRLLVIDHVLELYLLLLAGIFTAVGIWAGLRFSSSAKMAKTADHLPQNQQKVTSYPTPNDLCGLSQREYEVLVCLDNGLSTDEIASHLFVSPNTIKTHLGNLYQKLEVKRRTQAVQKARLLGLISDAGHTKG